MLPDRVWNPGPLTYKSGVLPIALSGPGPILANFPARSGRRASQPLFEAARKNDKVGIPVEKTASRQASQPPFWRIFQLDRAVGPPNPCSTPPENTTKWVFQSIKKSPKKSLWANAPMTRGATSPWDGPPPSPARGLVARLYEHRI